MQGSWKYQHRVGDAVTDGPLDLSAFTVQALVPTGSGFTTIGGTAHADGSFEIDNVAPGVTYLLRIGRSAFVTDQHSIVLRNSVPARFGVTVATQPTPVTFEIEGAVPFEINDELIVESRLADVGAFFLTTPAQTSVAATIEWMSETESPHVQRRGQLPDPSAGDDFVVLQYRTSAAPPGARSVQQILAAGNITAALRNGEPTTVMTTLRAPTQTFTVPSNLPVAPYATGHSPLTRPASTFAMCAALPGPAFDWQPDGSPRFARPIVAFRQEAPISTGIDLSGAFGDPFPSNWARYCSVTVSRTRALLVPGTSIPYLEHAGTNRAATAAALIATPVAPPTAIRIRGLDGDRGGLLRNDGMPVVMSWTGSAQASQYTVTINRLLAQGTRTSPQLLIRITTAEPTLTIPAEVLAGSDFLSFVVSAVNSTNAYATGTLTPSGIPSGSASAATAMFRWSSTCGDSTPDVGEACDPGGETASCDSDCTTAECGDGTRNVAAGELCDSIVDTPGCDSDCTANTCGDGHINAETEQCDDGGTAPGDGCSATCTSE